MKVDKTTMMITDMSDLDIEKLLSELDDMIFNGNITHYVRGVFEVWRNQCGIDERQSWIIMPTVFPLRVYMSVAKNQAAKG